jgi:hypothetical protein
MHAGCTPLLGFVELLPFERRLLWGGKPPDVFSRRGGWDVGIKVLWDSKVLYNRPSRIYGSIHG